jgi:pantoate--beta-alanine ligase
MQLIENARDLKSVLKNINNDKKIGFVPTMGHLHQGHLQLVREAMSENKAVIVSIFVNKRQFNEASDFEQYPKTLQADCNLLASVKEDIIVYAPNSAEELFPSDFKSISVELGGIENEMEGEHRPGHFQGVIDVVHQFFAQIKPTHAYFGEKDYQQLAVVKMLANQYFDGLQVIGVPTSRSSSGLALSSRNTLLQPKDLEKAQEVNISLKNISQNYSSQGSTCIANEQNRLEQLGFKIDYLTVADSISLQTANTTKNTKTLRAFAAVFLGGVRLIDNVAIKA